MKAIVFERYGGPDVLYVDEVPKPQPRANEILVRVCAAEATKSDCEMRQSKFPTKWFWPYLRVATGVMRPTRGRILGWYFSGIVDSIGNTVTRFKPGDEVFGCTKLRFGAYGEFVALPEDFTVVRKPANISFEDAAAVPLGGLNALYFLRRTKVRAGESVLVIGAGGSIGLFTVMIAKAWGAIVTAVDKTEKLDLVRSYGADEVIDYTREDYTRRSGSYDVVLSSVAHTPYAKTVGVLKPGGRYVVANPRVLDMLLGMWTSFTSDKSIILMPALEKLDELQMLADMLEAGTIRSCVGHVFPMKEATTAHRMVEAEQRQGAVVLRIGE